MLCRALLPSLYILAVSAFLFVNTWSIAETDVTTVSSAMFPRLILGVILCMTAITLWGEMRTLSLRGHAGKAVATPGQGFFVVLGLLALLLVLMKLCGFVAAATIFMSLFSLYISENWKTPKLIAKTVLINFVLALGIYYLFVHVLLFMLP